MANNNKLFVDLTVFTLDKPAILERENGEKFTLSFQSFERELPVIIAGNEVGEVTFTVFKGYDVLSLIEKSFDFSSPVVYNIVEANN